MTKKMEPLKLQGLYSLTTLARALGVAPRMLKRILRSYGVALICTKHAVLVPLSELKSRLPELWRSLVLTERLRAGVLCAT